MRAMKFFLSGLLLLGVAQASTFMRQTENSKSKVLAKIPDQSQQLVLVTARDWNTVDASLRLYERAAGEQRWHRVGDDLPVVVGRNGMAWGKGLHGDAAALAKAGNQSGPVKKEGDGRSPAGVFSLSSAFGYAPPEQAIKVKLPYTHATATLECVDDPRSANYNRLVERGKVANPDWKSSEQMRRSDEQYSWGAVVDHNAVKPQAGAGSCIFLHIRPSAKNAAGKGTAGCTAMEAAKMEELLLWLDQKKKPVLVQMPQAEFERLRESLGLSR
jgi:D-alanyl-D-alanine dipeptidase